MECNIQNAPKKKGYDPKVKKEEYEEWLKALCTQIANGKDYLTGPLLNNKGSQK